MLRHQHQSHHCEIQLQVYKICHSTTISCLQCTLFKSALRGVCVCRHEYVYTYVSTWRDQPLAYLVLLERYLSGVLRFQCQDIVPSLGGSTWKEEDPSWNEHKSLLLSTSWCFSFRISLWRKKARWKDYICISLLYKIVVQNFLANQDPLGLFFQLFFQGIAVQSVSGLG